MANTARVRGASITRAPGAVLPLEMTTSGNLAVELGSSQLTYTGSTNGTVTTTSGTLIAAGAYSNYLAIGTLPGTSQNIWLNLAGGPAVVNQGIYIPAAGGSATFGNAALPLPTGPITAIADGSGTATVTILGG